MVSLSVGVLCRSPHFYLQNGSNVKVHCALIACFDSLPTLALIGGVKQSCLQ